MKRSTNKQVIQSFLNGNEAHGGGLTTSGDKLYSYSLLIAERLCFGSITVYDYTATGYAYQSQTTSKHVGLIKREVRDIDIMLPELAKHIGFIN